MLEYQCNDVTKTQSLTFRAYTDGLPTPGKVYSALLAVQPYKSCMEILNVKTRINNTYPCLCNLPGDLRNFLTKKRDPPREKVLIRTNVMELELSRKSAQDDISNLDAQLVYVAFQMIGDYVFFAD